MASEQISQCSACRNFRPARRHQPYHDPEEPYVFGRRYKRRPLSDFIQSRRLGCSGCSLVLDAIEAWQPGWAADHENDGVLHLGLYESILTLDLCLAPSREIVETLQIFQSQESPCAPLLNKPICSTRGIIPDTTTPAAFQRATSWVQHCLDHHECELGTVEEYMPRRVLEVGTAGTGGEDLIRLVEDLTTPAPYVALSYCWGKDLTGVVTTRTANKKDHKQGLPVLSLPKTIQDAIKVCRGLGLSYLWVDALCIVQDDPKDWEREAAQMKNVYRCSRVCIAAHAAASCRDGFLGAQEFGQPRWQREFWTRFGPNERNRAFVRMGRPPRQDDYPEPTPSILTTRGWTLQEAVLPRRMVHFTGYEMVWECELRHFCECGHVDGIGRFADFPMVKTEFLRGEDGREAGRSLKGDGWMDLVQRYSQRNLTYGSDKLAAIAGLADLVAAEDKLASEGFAMSDIYLAGIFRSGVPAQLLWIVKDPDDPADGSVLPPTRRPEPYRAPTWSWASVDSHVEYPREAKDPPEIINAITYPLVSLVRIHGSETFLLPAPVNGNGRDLTLEGLVIPVLLLTCERPYKRKYDIDIDIPNDSLKGRASVIRTPDGKVYEVSCDLTRDIDVKIGDASYSCLVEEVDMISSGCDSDDGSGSHLDDDSDSDDADTEGGEKEDNSNEEVDCNSLGSIDDSLQNSDVDTEEDETDGSEDYGSDGRSSPAMVSEDPEETDRSQEGTDWESTDDESGEHEISDDGLDSNANGDSGEGKWCEKCAVEPGYWSQPRFCCLQMARYSSPGLPTKFFFLILKRSCLATADAWERVGMGTIQSYGDDEEPQSFIRNGERQRIRLV